MKIIIKYIILFFLFHYFSFSQWERVNKGIEDLDPWDDTIYNIIGVDGNLLAIYSGQSSLLFSDNYGEFWSIIDMHNGDFYPNWCSNCFKHVGDTVYLGNRRPTPSNIIYKSIKMSNL